MRRPYIICHMVTSVDGRIDCSMVEHISGDEYHSTLARLNCPVELEGRVTMEHYSAVRGSYVAPPPGARPVGKPSVHLAVKSPRYTVAVDTQGRLRWPSAEVNGAPLICLVSEQVSQAYLDGLRAQGISWICCGQERISLYFAMEVLFRDFGVERLALLGGGLINGAFLKAELIDELSLLVAPGIDGRTGQPSLVEGMTDSPRFLPTQLELISAEPLPHGVVWLRYRVEY